ncbi:MAG: beta-N-acetylhexosaminidase [Oscillospiraceae bacterium]|jgi:hexosaminidase|nr:beta-N-acetylhexosaminidase [Oscillospiraceae bacterium]
MSKVLPILPCPNKVRYTGGTITPAAINPEAAPVTVDSALPKEGYRLTISQSGAEISAADAAGEFYAKQSLRQLIAGDGEIPCCVIEDAPRFPHRGFMLDVARHMTGIEDIKKLIDAMALMKLNVFHWHLTDDQGWRVPIEKYPRLIEIGSVRKGSHFGHESTHSEEPYGGYYTLDELRDVVAYCAERHITVTPELDIPGHTVCAIAAYPYLSCRGEQLEVGTKQGIYDEILCVGRNEVMEFVFDVLDEFCKIFPGEYFHIGGDEAPKKRWKECPHCQQRMKDKGLANEEQLQGWFNKQVAEFLAKRGKKTIVWNEGLYSGQMGDEVIGQRWFDPCRAAIRFANKGGKVIMSDESNNYLNFPYGHIPLHKTYQYNPLRLGLNKRGKANVLGVEAPSWTEHIRDFDGVCYMTFPRLCAVAENAWSQNKDYSGFLTRLNELIPQLCALGIYPASPRAWDPKAKRRAFELKEQARGVYSAYYPMER